jgi:hypothetical protein
MKKGKIVNDALKLLHAGHLSETPPTTTHTPLSLFEGTGKDPQRGVLVFNLSNRNSNLLGLSCELQY